MLNIYPVNLFQISPVLSRFSAGVPRQCCYTLNCAASPFRIFKTRNELHILSDRGDIASRDKWNTLSFIIAGLLNHRSLPGQIVRRQLFTWIFFLVEGIVWNVLEGSVRRSHQFSFTGNIFPHSVGRDTAGVGAAPDDKTQPEPNVANQHDQSDHQDEQDGFVVGSSAGLLDLHQGGVVHQTVVEVRLAWARAGERGARGELLALKSPVELSPLAAALRLLVENIVLRKSVFGSGEVKFGHQSQPDGHGVLSVSLLVGRAQVWKFWK